MTKEKKLLMWTILAIVLLQMPTMALTPAIARIKENFSGYGVSTIQTVMALPNLVSPIMALAAFGLTRALTKKRVILLGLATMTVCGVGGLLLHSQLWHVCLWGVLIGCAMSWYLPTTMSLMLDSFRDDELRRVSGLQTSFINFGGIILSLLGGVAAARAWFGGYALYLLALPILIMAALFIPRVRRVPQPKGERKKTRLRGSVFFYSGVIFFYLFCNTVFASNIALYMAQTGLGATATTGAVGAVQLSGGVACGFIFGRLSRRLHDYVMPCAFGTLALGYLILSAFPYLPAVLLGAFLSGCGLSLCVPQCLFDISLTVDSDSSVLATSIATGIAPSLGSFISPSFFTNISTLIGGDDLRFRFLFSGICVLVIAAALLVLLLIRQRRKNGAAAN